MSTNPSQTQHGAHGSSNPQKVLNRTPALRKKKGIQGSVSPHMLDNRINNAVGPSQKKIFKSSRNPTVNPYIENISDRSKLVNQFRC